MVSSTKWKSRNLPLALPLLEGRLLGNNVFQSSLVSGQEPLFGQIARKWGLGKDIFSSGPNKKNFGREETVGDSFLWLVSRVEEGEDRSEGTQCTTEWAEREEKDTTRRAEKEIKVFPSYSPTGRWKIGMQQSNGKSLLQVLKHTRGLSWTQRVRIPGFWPPRLRHPLRSISRSTSQPGSHLLSTHGPLLHRPS